MMMNAATAHERASTVAQILLAVTHVLVSLDTSSTPLTDDIVTVTLLFIDVFEFEV